MLRSVQNEIYNYIEDDGRCWYGREVGGGEEGKRSSFVWVLTRGKVLQKRCTRFFDFFVIFLWFFCKFHVIFWFFRDFFWFFDFFCDFFCDFLWFFDFFVIFWKDVRDFFQYFTPRELTLAARPKPFAIHNLNW